MSGDRSAFERLDKNRLIARIRLQVEEELAAAAQSQKETQDGATHEESKAENDKDTRAIEAQYLSRGLAQRVIELESALTALSTLKTRSFDSDAPIALSALVELEDDETGEKKHYLLLPAGAGMRAESETLIVVVVTPKAPIGHALIGRQVDDEIELSTPRGKRRVTVSGLR